MEVPPITVAEPLTHEVPRSRLTWRQALSWLLLVGVIAAGWAAYTLGGTERSWPEFSQALRSGQVEKVELIGGFGAYSDDVTGVSGASAVTVRWTTKGHLWDRKFRTEVIEANPRSEANTISHDGATAVISPSLNDAIHQRNPNVTITQRELTGYSTLWGWETAPWVGSVVLGAFIAIMYLVCAGPLPWRGSRWGWAWMVLLGGPFGIGLFLLIAGPTGMFPPAAPVPGERPRRGLTGGWGFLLALILGSLTDSLR